ncbi:MAG: flagellar export chaperone FliS [Planctomycetaceae bacterium]|nr:flagellar export chaperone FliS [Planctomycetaceae bacterium]
MSQVAEYLESQVLTAGPHRLHLMVVDGAIRFARRGLEALDAHRWEDLFTALSRSRDCVAELLGGLDADQSPDLAARLKALFAFVYRNLALADTERNAQRIRDAIRILEIHRETWLELGEQLIRESAPGPSVPTPHARSWTT